VNVHVNSRRDVMIIPTLPDSAQLSVPACTFCACAAGAMTAPDNASAAQEINLRNILRSCSRRPGENRGVTARFLTAKPAATPPELENQPNAT
jgi:hypothetical protein